MMSHRRGNWRTCTLNLFLRISYYPSFTIHSGPGDRVVQQRTQTQLIFARMFLAIPPYTTVCSRTNSCYSSSQPFPLHFSGIVVGHARVNIIGISPFPSRSPSDTIQIYPGPLLPANGILRP